MKRFLCQLTLVTVVLSSMFVSTDAWAQGRGDRGYERDDRGQYERPESSYREHDRAGGPRENRGYSDRDSQEREPGLEKDGSRHSSHIHSLPKARRH